MKTFIVASLLAAFACVSAVQAGEDCQAKTCAAKTTCCAEKSACAKAALAKARAQASEKGATLLVKR